MPIQNHAFFDLLIPKFTLQEKLESNTWGGLKTLHCRSIGAGHISLAPAGCSLTEAKLSETDIMEIADAVEIDKSFTKLLILDRILNVEDSLMESMDCEALIFTSMNVGKDTSFSVEWLWYGRQYCFEAETVSNHPSNSVHIVYSGLGTASHLNKL
ncbi:unnamed protein product [Citrullus colocynthis]|uniref:Uncharacterized protein n=1 Tax=Citrullus colocynthis TaxID=252529 RepID=A0ABP0XLA6_9ROSI